MIKLTLDEKYRKLSDCINSLKPYYLLPEILVAAGRKLNNFHPETEELIAKIYLADEIEWVEEKHVWRLKSDRFWDRYIRTTVANEIYFSDSCNTGYAMSESELKKLLDGTGLPFEAFERVKIDA